MEKTEVITQKSLLEKFLNDKGIIILSKDIKPSNSAKEGFVAVIKYKETTERIIHKIEERHNTRSLYGSIKKIFLDGWEALDLIQDRDRIKLLGLEAHDAAEFGIEDVTEVYVVIYKLIDKKTNKQL